MKISAADKQAFSGVGLVRGRGRQEIEAIAGVDLPFVCPDAGGEY
ncbi:hypothetical protein [Verrucomicrobium spinosum]|nr:hypothetical protein [Verrucomicrobium spinosum]